MFLFQVLPVSRATRELRRNRGFAVNELVFQVQAPPLGYTTYSVSLAQDGAAPASTRHRTPTVMQNKVSLQLLFTLCPRMHFFKFTVRFVPVPTSDL